MLDRKKKRWDKLKESSLGTDLGTNKASVDRVKNDLFQIELSFCISQLIRCIFFKLYVKYVILLKQFSAQYMTKSVILKLFFKIILGWQYLTCTAPRRSVASRRVTTSWWAWAWQTNSRFTSNPDFLSGWHGIRMECQVRKTIKFNTWTIKS